MGQSDQNTKCYSTSGLQIQIQVFFMNRASTYQEVPVHPFCSKVLSRAAPTSTAVESVEVAEGVTDLKSQSQGSV